MPIMNHAATIQFRVSTNTKDKSFDVFKKHGLTLTDGLRIYLERVASLGEIPFSLNIPNTQTQKALSESQAGVGLSHFSSADGMFAHLDGLIK